MCPKAPAEVQEAFSKLTAEHPASKKFRLTQTVLRTCTTQSSESPEAESGTSDAVLPVAIGIGPAFSGALPRSILRFFVSCDVSFLSVECKSFMEVIQLLNPYAATHLGDNYQVYC